MTTIAEGVADRITSDFPAVPRVAVRGSLIVNDHLLRAFRHLVDAGATPEEAGVSLLTSIRSMTRVGRYLPVDTYSEALRLWEEANQEASA